MAKPIAVGDLVEITDPHPEKGARGVVREIKRATEFYERRARVEFHDPYGEGFSTVPLRWLRVIR